MFIGQNLGAQRIDRVKDAIRLAFRFTLIFQLALYALIFLLSPVIAAQFSDEINVQETIILYLKIVPLSYGVSGIIILINVAMNVLSKPRIALYINVIRLLFLYLPLAYFGSRMYGLNGFYIGITIGHFLAYILALIWFNKVLQEIDN